MSKTPEEWAAEIAAVVREVAPMDWWQRLNDLVRKVQAEAAGAALSVSGLPGAELSVEELMAIHSRAEASAAVSPPPWEWQDHHDPLVDAEGHEVVWEHPRFGYDANEADHDFIAHAVTDVTRLLAGYAFLRALLRDAASDGLLDLYRAGHAAGRKEGKEELSSLLRDLEWAGTTMSGGYPACPVCSMTEAEGHAGGCRLAAALKGTSG